MKQTYKMALLFMMLIGSAFTINAQKMSVTGKVSDNSGTVPGVSVLIKGTKTGTETDFDGKYTISAEKGAVLVFRYLGYKTIEKTVGNSAVINIPYPKTVVF